MVFRTEKEAKLILKDGTEFIGKSFGFNNSTSGEVVFNTGMVGYPETLSDPSYKGQILVITYPLVGNYGVPDDSLHDSYGISNFFESEGVHVAGVIVSDYSHKYSHEDAIKSLGDWLKENKVPAIYGLDTRAITKKLRETGVMLGKIVIDKDVKIVDPNKENQVAKVSIAQPVEYKNKKNKNKKNKKVLLVDCGVKNNIVRSFLKRGVDVKRVPWDYDFNNEEYDGLFISNGPGDPKKCEATITNLKKTLKKDKPVFGICLGSQLMALASGADTYKLKYGHRSHNQPCIERDSGKCYITSQNHGYAVDEKTLSRNWEWWFKNANDDTNEGVRHKSKPFYAVQFHPEAVSGPNDTDFLFDKFIDEL